MYAYKDLLELAGLTTRLYTLISTLHNLPRAPEAQISADGFFEIRNVDIAVPNKGMHQGRFVRLHQAKACVI